MHGVMEMPVFCITVAGEHLPESPAPWAEGAWKWHLWDPATLSVEVQFSFGEKLSAKKLFMLSVRAEYQ